MAQGQPYQITGREVRALVGHKFSVKNYDGRPVEFHIPPPGAGWPRGGLEAYGLLVNCHHPQHGVVPSFLKVFKADIPERQKRNAFLIKLGLAKHHPWLFSGMPYVVYRGHINGTQVVTHAAKQIGMDSDASEDIARLRLRGWSYPLDVRRRLVGHLCCAVGALEKLSFIHTDISAKNVIVTTAPDGLPAAVLCDYDGFFHPSQKPLPMHARPLGSVGYQYPELIAQIAAQHPDILITTDRFALGALACEIMVWNDKIEDELQRTELLTNTIVSQRDVAGIPAALRARWKDGFELLQAAMKAKTVAEMPSPKDWLQAIGATPDLIPVDRQFNGTPRITLRQRRGHPAQITKIRDVYITNPHGTFASASPSHPQLASVEFFRSVGALELKFNNTTPVALTRNAQALPVMTGPCRFAVQPGDRVDAALIQFEIRDDPGPNPKSH